MDDEQQTTVEAHLAAFAEVVRESPHNLLSDRALEELESRHIAESRAFAASLPSGASVLDLGTGGGFPGMVVAITRRDLNVTLLDATRKKIDFLQEFAATAEIPVQTLHGRAEELHREHAASFDVVCARAVAPLDRLIPWAVPFLKPGGTLHAIKGKRWPAELKAAVPVIQRLGAKVVAVPEQDVPASSGTGARHSTADPDSGSTVAPRVVIIQAAG